jgi:uncharacterized protein (DUF1330 family)
MATYRLVTILFCACFISCAQAQRSGGTPPDHSPDPERLKALESNPDDHPVVILKLLKYKGAEGRASYKRYAEVSIPRIRELGGEVVFYGKAKPFDVDFGGTHKLFGLRPCPWDNIVLERYRSRADLRRLGESEDYRAATVHRRNGLEKTVLYALNGSRRSIAGAEPRIADIKLAPDPPIPNAIYMLNLLKFNPGDGESSYFQKYGAAVMPLLKKHGAKVIYTLEAEQSLIGEEHYDRVILVMYPSVEEFTKMILSEAYQKISHHRADALEIGHLFGFSNEVAVLKIPGE